MVFHSHYMVTDKKTGINHSLCCYKECNNPQVILNDEKDKNIIIENTSKGDILTNFDDKYLSKNDKVEKIRKNSLSENENENDDNLESLMKSKKSSQKKSPIFKLKIPSDIVSESFKRRYKAYKASIKNSIPSGYSSDEYIEMDTDTELDSVPVNTSSKPVERNFQISKKIGNRDFNEKECFEIDATEFSTLSEGCNIHNDTTKSPSTASNSDYDYNPDTKSQQKSNQVSIDTFHKAVEDARNAMITLVDKFCFEQHSSSPVVQSPQENCINTSKVNQKDSRSQEELAVVVSKQNIVDTNKILFNARNKKKSKQAKSQFGTPEFPIDLDNDDYTRTLVKSPVLNDDDNDIISERDSKVKSIQSQDNLMINWFDRDDFKKFMLSTAKHRLEELDNDGQNSKKRVRVGEQSFSSSFRNPYDISDDQNDHLESSIIQVPDFKNQKYLRLALTHRSIHSDRQNWFDYVRLEIFGDCILSTTISQMAYEKFKDQLTPDLLEKIHNNLCSNYNLCKFAKMLKLQDLIYARKPFLSEKEIANVFTSLLAAIIMDSGREIAVNFIRKLIGPTMDRLVRNGKFIGIQISETNEKIPIKNVVDDQYDI
ncbi:hypothetical protein RclHR1_04320008 [Rhizophagus clarus]|uniref:Ribonuclease III n=1 Tax=Rhizophagus clarus TaxID=94130 RepID=A0A2Z6SAK0_9GLOM|nr:hypothetical protein RclHR1_04320008 [Rhizophagus clarus]GES97463.1 ribonuclease III [Rhizophagus clarus]